MDLNHLRTGEIDSIALQLSEDVYGANGELDGMEVIKRLERTIAAECGLPANQHAHSPAITLAECATLVFGVWCAMDRSRNDALIPGPLPPEMECGQ
jgi:hypothetical protein